MRAGTWPARVTFLAPAAALIAACGHPAPALQQPAPPAPTPRPATGLVAVLDSPLGSLGNTVRVLRADGSQVAAAALPEDTEAVTLAGDRVLFGGGGRLRRLENGGVVVDLGDLGDDPDTLVRGLVASPDGRRWMWAAVSQDQSGTVHDTIRLGGDGLAPRTLLTRTETASALQPVAWTAAGAVVADEPLGIGGYVLFRREFGPTSLIDPAGGGLTPLLADDCAYSDSLATGVSACIADGREGVHGAAPVSLHLVSRQGGLLTVSLPGDVAQAGDAWFSPDGRRLTLATSPALADQSEVIHCLILDVQTAQTVGGCPDGLSPAGWVAPDHFAAFRTPGTGGGESGTFVVGGDGTAVRISTASTVVGVGSGQAAAGTA